MSAAPSLILHWTDWLALFGQYMILSLLSVGGGITTVSEMHRYLVDQHGWLSDAQFNASIALAQAAPGPNILFVALMGWNVGMNAGSMLLGALGVATTMFGILLPSTILTYLAARWGHNNRDLRWVRAFKQGMAPIVVGLMIATGWILTSAHPNMAHDWPLWLLTIVTALIIWRIKVHILWLLAIGALLGIFGIV
ncbi:chromate transporter [Noviherbaspirillum humi]|uniref:Chromate transporter n=1 Tax=Noviherbaspirillum humi TaxID=1688639 RepID=A0A239FSS0_9BURK|nr:chromate transporter [Noviherbaspirillum humi]SNS60116.1 chromate transporter [Noviherbaspirillum humi]